MMTKMGWKMRSLAQELRSDDPLLQTAIANYGRMMILSEVSKPEPNMRKLVTQCEAVDWYRQTYEKIPDFAQLSISSTVEEQLPEQQQQQKREEDKQPPKLPKLITTIETDQNESQNDWGVSQRAAKTVDTSVLTEPCWVQTAALESERDDYSDDGNISPVSDVPSDGSSLPESELDDSDSTVSEESEFWDKMEYYWAIPETEMGADGRPYTKMAGPYPRKGRIKDNDLYEGPPTDTGWFGGGEWTTTNTWGHPMDIRPNGSVMDYPEWEQWITAEAFGEVKEVS